MRRHRYDLQVFRRGLRNVPNDFRVGGVDDFHAVDLDNDLAIGNLRLALWGTVGDPDAGQLVAREQRKSERIVGLAPDALLSWGCALELKLRNGTRVGAVGAVGAGLGAFAERARNGDTFVNLQVVVLDRHLVKVIGIDSRELDFAWGAGDGRQDVVVVLVQHVLAVDLRDDGADLDRPRGVCHGARSDVRDPGAVTVHPGGEPQP